MTEHSEYTSKLFKEDFEAMRETNDMLRAKLDKAIDFIRITSDTGSLDSFFRHQAREMLTELLN